MDSRNSMGFPVCPADEVMRKNEGNLTREEYADMMGFKKPDDDSGWAAVAEVLTIAIVVMVLVSLLSGCATPEMSMQERQEIGRDFCKDPNDTQKKESVRELMDDYVIDGFGQPQEDMIFFMGLACARSEQV